MGQAKRRGTRQERIAAAIALQQKEEPINVPCKTCGEILNGFEFHCSMPSGAAWTKKCECGATTFALVQAKDSSLQRTFKSSLSLSKELTGGVKGAPVSVSFFEKNLDTIETGIVRLGD